MYERRLDFKGDLSYILARACGAYNIGSFISHHIIETGFEDFNFKIETTSGKYVAKIFSHSREDWEVPRLVSIYEKVESNNISIPKLYKADGKLLFSESNINMIMMDWIEGQTFYEIGAINDDDLYQVIENAAQIHKINFSGLSFRIDSWAVQNRHELWNWTRDILRNLPEYEFIRNDIATFDKIPYDDLPHAFCHGDISKQNTIRRLDGKIFHLDWSVANIYPRIHDLSVIATELTYKNGRTLKENAKIILDIYSEFSPLEKIEQDCFMDYIRGAITSLFLAPIGQKYILKQDDDQTNFFITNARDLIMQAQRG